MGSGRLGEEYMEHVNWLGVVLGAVAFFAVGALVHRAVRQAGHFIAGMAALGGVYVLLG